MDGLLSDELPHLTTAQIFGACEAHAPAPSLDKESLCQLVLSMDPGIRTIQGSWVSPHDPGTRVPERRLATRTFFASSSVAAGAGQSKCGRDETPVIGVLFNRRSSNSLSSDRRFVEEKRTWVARQIARSAKIEVGRYCRQLGNRRCCLPACSF